MKKLQLLFLFMSLIVLFNGCTKEDTSVSSVSPTTKPVAIKMTDLVIQPSFDWQTTNTYQFTFTGSQPQMISIGSSTGLIYYQMYVKPQTASKITLSFPSYEKKVHFLYNGKDVEYSLNTPLISYTLN